MIIRLHRRRASMPKTTTSPTAVEPPPATSQRSCPRLMQQPRNPTHQRLDRRMSLAVATAARIQSIVVLPPRQRAATTGVAGELPIKPSSTAAPRLGLLHTLAMPSKAPRGYASLTDCDDPPSVLQSLLQPQHTDFSTESASSSVTSATALEFWNPSEDAPENPSMEYHDHQGATRRHVPDHGPPPTTVAGWAAPASTLPGPIVAEDRPQYASARNLSISDPGTILEHIRPHGGRSIDRSVLSKAGLDEPQRTGPRTGQEPSSSVIVAPSIKSPARDLTKHGHHVAGKGQNLSLPSNAHQGGPPSPKLPVLPTLSNSSRVRSRDDDRGPVDLDLSNKDIDVDSDSNDDDDAWSGEFFVNEREDGELYRGLMGYVKGFEPRTIYRLQAQTEHSKEASLVVRNGGPPQAAKGPLSSHSRVQTEARHRRVKFEIPNSHGR